MFTKYIDLWFLFAYYTNHLTNYVKTLLNTDQIVNHF